MIWKVLGMIGSLVMIPVILGVSAGVTLFINLITPQVEPGCSLGCPKYPAIVITIGVLLAIGMVIGWLIFASKSIFKNPKPSDQRGNTQGETGVYPKINCTNCGTAIEPEGDFCGSCGRPKSAMDHPVDIIDIFRPSEDVLPFVEDAIKKKPKVIWLQEGIHNSEAEELARNNGIMVVFNRCMLAEHKRLF